MPRSTNHEKIAQVPGLPKCLQHFDTQSPPALKSTPSRVSSKNGKSVLKTQRDPFSKRNMSFQLKIRNTENPVFHRFNVETCRVDKCLPIQRGMFRVFHAIGVRRAQNRHARFEHKQSVRNTQCDCDENGAQIVSGVRIFNISSKSCEFVRVCTTDM